MHNLALGRGDLGLHHSLRFHGENVLKSHGYGICTAENKSHSLAWLPHHFSMAPSYTAHTGACSGLGRHLTTVSILQPPLQFHLLSSL